MGEQETEKDQSKEDDTEGDAFHGGLGQTEDDAQGQKRALRETEDDTQGQKRALRETEDDTQGQKRA